MTETTAVGADAAGNPPVAPAPLLAPAAAAPAPAPAPVTPKVDAAAAAAGGSEPSAVSYEPSGDPALDVALGFIGGLGINSEHPAMVAALKGDFSIMKATLATLGDKAKGWENMVALGEKAYADAQTQAATAAAAVTKAVHGVAGSAEAWTQIQTWASANASPEEKAEINAMFAAGPVQARAAAQLLQGLYNKAQGTVVNPRSPLAHNASGGRDANPDKPLSRVEYAAAVQQLSHRIGSGNLAQSREYAELQRRRAAHG